MREQGRVGGVRLVATITVVGVQRACCRGLLPGSRRETALAVVSYWSDSEVQVDNGGSHGARLSALRQVLKTFSLYSVDVKIVLVTNAWVSHVADIVARQVVRPEPICGPPAARAQHNWCLPWEAIRVLSRGWASPSCRGEAVHLRLANCSGAGGYDYYLYLEGDHELPAASFEFWRRRAPALHACGYLLLPHTREVMHRGTAHSSDVMAACHTPSCLGETKLFLDVTRLSESEAAPSGSVYLQPANPYSGCSIMTCAQFAEYLDGAQWDYGCAENPLGYGIRELAATTLLSDPRYGRDGALTHLSLPVYHLLPRTGVFHAGADGRKFLKRNISSFEFLVSQCAAGSSACHSLEAREVLRCRGAAERPCHWDGVRSGPGEEGREVILVDNAGRPFHAPSGEFIAKHLMKYW